MKNKNLQIEKLDIGELMIIYIYQKERYSDTILKSIKKELNQRQITESRLEKFDLEWSNKFNKKQFKQQIELELKKTESYSYIQMISVLIFGTIFFLRPHHSFLKSLGELKKENLILKYKQKIILLIIGHILLFVQISFIILN